MSEEVRKRGRPPKPVLQADALKPVDNPMKEEAQEGVNVQVVETDTVVEYTRPQTDMPEMGTTQRLFPNYSQVSEGEQSQEEGNTIQAPSENVEILDANALKGKKFKAVIDGQEKIVDAEELIKGYQTDQYLTQKGQRIAEERRKWAEEKKQLEEAIKSMKSRRHYYDEDVYGDYTYNYNPSVDQIKSLEMKLQELEKRNAAMEKYFRQQEYELNRRKLKEELGSDADIYLPRIQQFIAGLENPELIAFYDTIEGAKSLYYKMKYEDMLKEQSKKKQEGVEKPPIVKLEQTQTSAREQGNESAYMDMLKRASVSGHPDDWNKVLKMKGVI